MVLEWRSDKFYNALECAVWWQRKFKVLCCMCVEGDTNCLYEDNSWRNEIVFETSFVLWNVRRKCRYTSEMLRPFWLHFFQFRRIVPNAEPTISWNRPTPFSLLSGRQKLTNKIRHRYLFLQVCLLSKVSVGAEVASRSGRKETHAQANCREFRRSPDNPRLRRKSIVLWCVAMASAPLCTSLINGLLVESETVLFDTRGVHGKFCLQTHRPNSVRFGLKIVDRL